MRLLVEMKANCRCTGTGKSALLREIIKAMREKYANNPEAVAITASTGLFSLIDLEMLATCIEYTLLRLIV